MTQTDPSFPNNYHTFLQKFPHYGGTIYNGKHRRSKGLSAINLGLMPLDEATHFARLFLKAFPHKSFKIYEAFLGRTHTALRIRDEADLRKLHNTLLDIIQLINHTLEENNIQDQLQAAPRLKGLSDLVRTTVRHHT